MRWGESACSYMRVTIPKASAHILRILTGNNHEKLTYTANSVLPDAISSSSG